MAGSSSSMRGSRQRRAMADINVVPYIDVMLVLLVIFMVTAPLVAPSIVITGPPQVTRASWRGPSTRKIERGSDTLE